jgi:hypothetical protein
VETLMHFSPQAEGEETGLVIMGEQPAAICLRRIKNSNRLVLRVNDSVQELAAISSSSIRLRVEVEDGGICTFGFAEMAQFRSVPQGFQARKCNWMGAKVGIYSLAPSSGAAGFAEYEYFRFAPPEGKGNANLR